MLRLLTAALVAFFSFAASAQTPLPDLPLGDAAAFDSAPHIIVTARLPAGQTDVAWAEALAAENDLTVVAIWPLRSIDILCFVFAVTGDPSSAIRAITERSEVEFAYPVQSFETSSSAVTYRDEYAQLQDGHSQMQVWAAHAVTRGEGVTVALVDTAVDARHSDLSGQDITRRNFVSRADLDTVAEKHGTAMAAIVLADATNGEGMVGVAPEASLLALRACWEDDASGKGRCNTFSLARALNFALLNDADVINLSLTGPPDPILEQLIASALRRNIAVVIAAPAQQGDSLGRGLPGVFLTSAVARKGALMAPGTEILSAKPVDDYDFFSGSSVAAAHMTGALALLRVVQPGATLGELFAALLRGGDGGGNVVKICQAAVALNDRLLDCRDGSDRTALQ